MHHFRVSIVLNLKPGANDSQKTHSWFIVCVTPKKNIA